MRRPCVTPKCRDMKKKSQPEQTKTRAQIRSERKAAKASRIDRSNIQAEATFDPNILTSKSEADRLWRWAFVGTSTAVALIENYARMGLPSADADHIISLIQRLKTAADIINENQTSE